jgi:hypothetical protein
MVHSFGESKVYIDEASVVAEGSLRRAIVRYVLVPHGTDRRNGRAIKEMLMHEEYDLSASTFRVHGIAFTYDDGEVAEPLSTEPAWQQATGGSERNLDYLRLRFAN